MEGRGIHTSCLRSRIVRPQLRPMGELSNARNGEVGVPLRISEARDGLAGTCDSCGEAGAAECTFAVGMTLWPCDACDCGYVGGGAETEGLLDHYVEMLGLDADEEADLRERI